MALGAVALRVKKAKPPRPLRRRYVYMSQHYEDLFDGSSPHSIHEQMCTVLGEFNVELAPHPSVGVPSLLILCNGVFDHPGLLGYIEGLLTAAKAEAKAEEGGRLKRHASGRTLVKAGAKQLGKAAKGLAKEVHAPSSMHTACGCAGP